MNHSVTMYFPASGQTTVCRPDRDKWWGRRQISGRGDDLGLRRVNNIGVVYCRNAFHLASTNARSPIHILPKADVAVPDITAFQAAPIFIKAVDEAVDKAGDHTRLRALPNGEYVIGHHRYIGYVTVVGQPAEPASGGLALEGEHSTSDDIVVSSTQLGYAVTPSEDALDKANTYLGRGNAKQLLAWVYRETIDPERFGNTARELIIKDDLKLTKEVFDGPGDKPFWNTVYYVKHKIFRWTGDVVDSDSIHWFLINSGLITKAHLHHAEEMVNGRR